MNSTLPLSLDRQDLDHVLQGVGTAWEALRGQRLLLTGGTGFVGKWLLASLLHANRELGLNAQVVLLSRDPSRLRNAHPELTAEAALHWIGADVRSFELPPELACSHAIHAAADVVASTTPEQTFDTCVRGTQRVIERMRRHGGQTMLLLSSGAVYGQPGAQAIDEDWRGAPDPLQPASAYGEGKRAMELLGAMAAAEGMTVPVARCFAFVGPHLPLDKHFAIGNFIGAAMAGRTIQIQGDGTPLRSYMHAADLSLWLWTLLLKGRSGRAYNVGGDEALSIEALARRVVKVLGSDSEVQIAKAPLAGAVPLAYVPNIRRAADELGLQPRINLDEAIARTALWHRNRTHP